MRNVDPKELERRAQVVADDYGGMQPHCLVFYKYSIRYSAEMCLESFFHYEELKNQATEADYLVSVLQEAVGHAAALSRYFWPSPSGTKKSQLQNLKKKRGEFLRNLFGLNENSPLYDRDLRNAWEHFDERLDIYFIENIAGMFYPLSMIGSHTEADSPIGHVFKLLDPEEECLVLMNRKYFFAPIREEVEKIYTFLEKELKIP